jgi:hypothetical protein
LRKQGLFFSIRAICWEVISNFGAACQYLVMLIDCTVAGQGIGAQCRLTYTDGATIVERLETLDGVAHRLSSSLSTDTPFRDYVTTMAVRDLGPSRAESAWSATFEADGISTIERIALLKRALMADCLAQ